MVVATALAIGSTLVAPARADTGEGAVKAQERFERGVELFRKKRYAEAASEFQSAYDLDRSNVLVLYNLALAHEELKQYTLAAAELERYLADRGPEISSERRKKAEATLEKLKGRLASIEVRVTRGDGATVLVDGAPVGKSPMSKAIRVDPGVHHVSASLDGYEGADRTVSLPEAGSASVDLVLCPAKAAQVRAEAAQTLLDEGRALREAGDLRGSLAAFAAADAVLKTPVTGIALARAHEALGQLLDARAAVRRLGDGPADPAEATSFASARADAATLEKQLATRIPSVTVVTDGLPASASFTVTVDHTLVPTQGHRAMVEVDPGPHEVLVVAPGYGIARRAVTVRESVNEIVRVQLAKRQKASPTPAWIWVSGATGLVALGVTAAFGIDLAVAVHDDQVVCPNAMCTGLSDPQIAARIARTNRDLALLLTFGAIGVGGAGAALGGLARNHPDRSYSLVVSRLTWAPWITREGYGTVVGGRF